MVWKMVAAAVVVVAAGWGVAHAQSANDLSNPRELPPASYKGQQYVDSRGCVFLRAGLGGRVNWVARVRADRRQLCGYPPTFGAGSQVAVENIAPATEPRVAAAPRVPTPAPAPITGRKPIDTIASITTPPLIRQVPAATAGRVPASQYVPPALRQAPPPQVSLPRVAAPPVAEIPRGKGAERVRTTPGTGKIACYADAPVAERFALRGGGSVVMCTKGDGDLGHARAPRLPGGSAAVAPSGFVEGAVRPRGAHAGAVVLSTQDRNPPKGYKQAWDDDRLNPARGKGTREGWAQQDQVWTRDLPAQLVDEVDQKKARRLARERAQRMSEATGRSGAAIVISTASQKAGTTEPRRKAQPGLSISTKAEGNTAPVKKQAAAGGKSYVQVGTFGVVENAEGASSRLRAAGLPVALKKTMNGGRQFQVVMAGPFASGAEAQSALAAARRAGFSDAFIR